MLLFSSSTYAVVAIPTWLINLGPIALGACLALIGVVLTNRANTARLKLQLEHEKELAIHEKRQQRLEALFEQLDSWWLMVHNTTDILVRVDVGKTTLQSYLDYMIELQSEGVPNFGLIEMRLKIFAPSLRESYQKLIKSRDRWGSYMTSVKDSLSRASAASPVTVTAMMNERKELDMAVKELKDEIVKLAVD